MSVRNGSKRMTVAERILLPDVLERLKKFLVQFM
jgi:hypothetical protein